MDLFNCAVRVDSFQAGAEAYFLTHYHSDHMSGLTRKWRHGPLYCTPGTAALLRAGHGYAEGVATAVELGETVSFQAGGARIEATAIEANHCPGACMFLFAREGRKTLVTGDFRLDDGLRAALPSLAGVEELYVDVTYHEPSYDFPPQEKVIAEIARHLERVLYQGRRDLVVIETYTIGKNKVLAGLYEVFRKPFYLDDRRLALYRALGQGGMVTGDAGGTTFFACGSRGMEGAPSAVYPDWRRRSTVVHPTGWASSGKRFRGGIGFPYSEHCSYSELLEFLRALKPGKISLTEGGQVVGLPSKALRDAAGIAAP